MHFFKFPLHESLERCLPFVPLKPFSFVEKLLISLGVKKKLCTRATLESAVNVVLIIYFVRTAGCSLTQKHQHSKHTLANMLAHTHRTRTWHSRRRFGRLTAAYHLNYRQQSGRSQTANGRQANSVYGALNYQDPGSPCHPKPSRIAGILSLSLRFSDLPLYRTRATDSVCTRLLISVRFLQGQKTDTHTHTHPDGHEYMHR